MLINSQKIALFNGFFYNHSNVSLTSSQTNNRRDKRNLDIRNEYKAKHRKGFRSDFIITALADEYHLAEITIEHIVFERGYYRNSTVPVAIVVHSTENSAQA